MKIDWHRVWRWWDDNVLWVLASFLVVFIPLMPKIPLADLIPGYIVRMRAEDVVILLAFVIYVIWAWRGKIDWRMPTWKLIFAYVAVGAMSIVSGLWILQTIPYHFGGGVGELLASNVHVMKSLLHWARYIEYFFLAFLFFSTVTTRRRLRLVETLSLVAVIAVSVYAFGQKYFYWPVYSTMNREFAKGVRLVLTPHARVQSTFAGHYDFAAYLVLMLPLSFFVARHSQHRGYKALAWTSHFLGVWSLIVAAARTSVIAYLVAMILAWILDISLTAGSTARKFGRWFGQQTVYFVLVGLLIFGWGQDMIERFTHVLDRVEVLHNAYHTANKWRKELPYKLGWKEWEQPEGTVAIVVDDLGNNSVSVVTPTDNQPVPVKLPTPTPLPSQSTAPARPADVYEDIPDIKIGYDASGNAYLYEATRTWSVNAEKYGLSMAIRFDTLWPNAWRGFLRSPLTGSGYATLTKGEKITLFTEADSTDNNYLRVLGETGILGLVTFFGTIVVALWTAFGRLRDGRRLAHTYDLAFVTATIGLLVNALYIDVFAASKVAFTYWLMFGVFWAQTKFASDRATTKKDKTTRKVLPS